MEEVIQELTEQIERMVKENPVSWVMEAFNRAMREHEVQAMYFDAESEEQA